MFIWFCNLKMSHLFLMKKHKLKTFKVKSLTLSINSNQHTLNRADSLIRIPGILKFEKTTRMFSIRISLVDIPSVKQHSINSSVNRTISLN